MPNDYEVWNYIETIAAKQSRRYQHEIDGMVIKVNAARVIRNRIYRESTTLGDAYKFPAEEAQTIVRDIEWTVGRTGL